MVESMPRHTRPGPHAARAVGGAGERSVASYFEAFAPAPEWDELVRWPPDVFALANLLLDHTVGYRFVVAPPAGESWPPLPDWSDQVRSAGQAWRNGDRLPELVGRYWSVVTRNRDTALAAILCGGALLFIAVLICIVLIAVYG